MHKCRSSWDEPVSQGCLVVPAALVGWLAVSFPTVLRLLGSNVWGSVLQGYGATYLLRFLDCFLLALCSACLSVPALLGLLLYAVLAAPVFAVCGTFAKAYSGTDRALTKAATQGMLSFC